MKQNLSIFLYCLIMGITTLNSCSTNTQRPSSVVSIEKTDSCTLSPSVSYEIYIPKISDGCSDLPLLVVIDPKGDGKLCIEKFKRAATGFNCIILGSNTIKNGSQNYIGTLNMLVDDARAKYSSGRVLILAGFSGGARMALNYAQYYPVDGVISCGAIAAPEQLKILKCPVICVVGMADFNFIEAAQYIFNPEQAPAILNLQFTHDSHVWPESTVLFNALGLLFLIQKNNPECALVNKQIKDFTKNQEVLYDSLLNSNNYIEAGLLARNFAKMDYSFFSNKLSKLEYSPEFNNTLDQLRESIRFELTVRNAYYSALREESIQWWEKEIKSINQNITEELDVFRSYALKRIKGFLGIMCYSLCNNSIRNNDLISAGRLLELYRLIEPENPDMFYFSALLAYKNRHTASAIGYLFKSLQSGFTDMELLEADFPEEIVDQVRMK